MISCHANCGSQFLREIWSERHRHQFERLLQHAQQKPDRVLYVLHVHHLRWWWASMPESLTLMHSPSPSFMAMMKVLTPAFTTTDLVDRDGSSPHLTATVCIIGAPTGLPFPNSL